MPLINTIFFELLILLPLHRFEMAVCAHVIHRYAKRLTPWRQFTTLPFAQISRKENLRENETWLLSPGEWLYWERRANPSRLRILLPVCNELQR